MKWVFITKWFHTEKYLLTIPSERNDPATAKQRSSKVYRYKNMTAIQSIAPQNCNRWQQ